MVTTFIIMQSTAAMRMQHQQQSHYDDCNIDGCDCNIDCRLDCAKAKASMLLKIKR
jgi:hypothetical protein